MPIGNEDANLNKALTCKETASFLATTVKTLEAWRYQGKGPVYLKQGRSIRYRLRDLLAFQEQHVISIGKAARDAGQGK